MTEETTIRTYDARTEIASLRARQDATEAALESLTGAVQEGFTRVMSVIEEDRKQRQTPFFQVWVATLATLTLILSIGSIVVGGIKEDIVHNKVELEKIDERYRDRFEKQPIRN